jgi:predicted Ser/Thr protein kinase
MNPEAKTCPTCQGVIPADAPGGLCPRCVLTGAAQPTDAGLPAPSRADPPTLAEVTAAFPQLEIVALLGAGGMGYVYRVRQPALGREAALKLLPRHLAADPAWVERFTREARTLARLNHPNIVGVYEFGQTAGFGYLLMEFVDGANLRQAMRAGRFTPEQALVIVPRICDALQYAHGEGVLHRDIKPENILLDTQGRVKIADFGIAKLLGEAPGSRADLTLTLSGMRLGTPHYMAPEQIEKPGDVDHRADIYSLGVVFYELLTGELPLGRFPAPSEKAALDARVDEIVFRALAKERALRQQSAGEVKTEVEGLGGPAPSRPAARPTAQSPDSGLRRCLLLARGLAGMAAVYLVVAVGLLWGQLAMAEAAGNRGLRLLIISATLGVLLAVVARWLGKLCRQRGVSPDSSRWAVAVGIVSGVLSITPIVTARDGILAAAFALSPLFCALLGVTTGASMRHAERTNPKAPVQVSLPNLALFAAGVVAILGVGLVFVRQPAPALFVPVEMPPAEATAESGPQPLKVLDPGMPGPAPGPTTEKPDPVAAIELRAAEARLERVLLQIPEVRSRLESPSAALSGETPDARHLLETLLKESEDLKQTIRALSRTAPTP